jgi:hypothetical protein
MAAAPAGCWRSRQGNGSNACLRYMLDENEFLSPFGIRSVSRVHEARPFVLRYNGNEHWLSYAPGEALTGLFGGNSNWRGPVWLPPNCLLVEALERYHHFYGDALTVECPTGSGRRMNLQQVARELSGRLAAIFLRDDTARRPCHGGERRYGEDPHWRDLALFHEYFHGETGRGCGASHQTGWSSLAMRFIDDWARSGELKEGEVAAARAFTAREADSKGPPRTLSV